jgi:hypothetical protein
VATGVEPAALAATRDASILVVETRANRVRRIAPDGSVTAFAGTGRRGFSGDGGPARAARLDGPTSAAVLSDGSAVIADEGNFRVRRVRPDGTIDTVMGDGTHDAVDADSTPLGYAIVTPSRVAATTDGGFVVTDCTPVTEGCRLRYVPGGGAASLLGLAVDMGEPRRGGGDAFVSLSAAARVRLTASRGQRAVAIRAASLPRGFITRVRLSHIGPPGPYRIAAAARTSDGRAAYQRDEAYLGDRLTLRWARRFALHTLRLEYSRTATTRRAVAVGRCHPFSRLRTDCELLTGPPRTRPTHCAAVLSTVLDDDLAWVWYRRYRCSASPQRRFMQRPRYIEAEDNYYSLGPLADRWRH